MKTDGAFAHRENRGKRRPLITAVTVPTHRRSCQDDQQKSTTPTANVSNLKNEPSCTHRPPGPQLAHRGRAMHDDTRAPPSHVRSCPGLARGVDPGRDGDGDLLCHPRLVKTACDRSGRCWVWVWNYGTTRRKAPVQ
jgi:hypothetical protein